MSLVVNVWPDEKIGVSAIPCKGQLETRFSHRRLEDRPASDDGWHAGLRTPSGVVEPGNPIINASRSGEAGNIRRLQDKRIEPGAGVFPLPKGWLMVE